jgi:predicted GNAT family acetyltransferase
MSIEEPQLVARQTPARRRYELMLGRERVGYIQYRDDHGTRVFLHTEIEPDYAGHGLATQLIEWALADVRESGLRIRSQCPTVSNFLERNSEFDDILDRE